MSKRFARYAVHKDATRKFHLLGVEPNADESIPALIGKCASEGNANCVAEITRIAPARRKLVRQISDGTFQGDIEEAKAKHRKEDAEIYAEHVITAWENVQDENGKDIPFDKEILVEFLCIVPDIVWQGITAFFQNPSNFTGGALSRAEAIEAGNA